MNEPEPEPDPLAVAIQGITPIEYDEETRLVRMHVGSLLGSAVSWSWEVALVVAEEIRKAAEAGRKHSIEKPDANNKEASLFD